MNDVADLLTWLFSIPPGKRSFLSVIGWWEARRIPYNLIVGTVAVGSLGVFFVSISTSGRLQPGEDAIEPLALIAAPFIINVLYTTGWLLEVVVNLLSPRGSGASGLRLFKVGLGFSIAVVSIPGLFWGGYRALQLLHLIP